MKLARRVLDQKVLIFKQIQANLILVQIIKFNKNNVKL